MEDELDDIDMDMDDLDLELGGGSFHRINSDTGLDKDLEKYTRHTKPWERSQSEVNLGNTTELKRGASKGSVDYGETGIGAGTGKVSEHSKVYWDLSKAEDEAAGRGGKLKISLQTIHQKQELQHTSSRGSVSVEVYRRRTSSTDALDSRSPPVSDDDMTDRPKPSKADLKTCLTARTVVMKQKIKRLLLESASEQCAALEEILDMIEEAWSTPQIGRDLAYGLCDVLRIEGGLDILMKNCTSKNHDVQLASARLLEQSLTTGNRDKVAKEGLEPIVKLSDSSKGDIDLSRASTGILESLFKHSEDTCTKVIKLGGLDSLLYACRSADMQTMRHCAVALANLAMYGGADNQQEMIDHKAPEWLFPLAFSSDDSIRYYACLAITALSANKEIETEVVRSGTLELVQPFVLNHDPLEFARSDKSHVHGRSKGWLQRLIPVLNSKREEAQSLAAFHFAMEANIKKDQDRTEVFEEIGAVVPLKKVASSPNKIASKFAAEALKIIGEEVPYQLSAQVPLWTTADTQHWIKQIGFEEFLPNFEKCRVDGDVLLLLDEDNLVNDLKMTNGITRKRFWRELKDLKIASDYRSCDPTKLTDWLCQVGEDLSQYSYQMLRSGVDMKLLRHVKEDHLKDDCVIRNGVHRLKMLESIKNSCKGRGPYANVVAPESPEKGSPDKPIDVFISYRRSTGSQLASLLKVHLQLRGFTVFLDIERLMGGKFDDNLLNSVRNAKHFILVLTPEALDRCQGDDKQKDWVHREIVAAIESACNIIPVTDNFNWPSPEMLPEDMRSICYFNGIRWIHDYQDACVDKLERFLLGEINATTLNGLEQVAPPPAYLRPLSKSSSIGSSHGDRKKERERPMFRWSSTDTERSPEEPTTS